MGAIRLQLGQIKVPNVELDTYKKNRWNFRRETKSGSQHADPRSLEPVFADLEKAYPGGY